MIDTKAILASVNILNIIEADLGRHIKKSGKYVFFRCPFHNENTPSFGVTEANGRYFCFGCGKSGDAITWMLDYHKMSFQEACDFLSGGKAINTKWISSYDPCEEEETIPPLPDHLQDSWKKIIEDSKALLFSKDGEKALSYLVNQRKITEKTIKSDFVQLGYTNGIDVDGVHIGRGIVIPCLTDGYVNYVKIRLPVGKPKYIQLPADGYDLCALYGASLAKGADVVFVTEGEFDSMIIKQEAGDLVGSVTLGSASQHFYEERYGETFKLAKHVIVSLDNDEAGQKALEKWKSHREVMACLYGKVKYAHTPEGFKDVNDFHVAGGDVAKWVMDTLSDMRIE